jgi:hypothetical protein
MKRFLLSLFPLFLTLMSSAAFADHIYLMPNTGSGDNFLFIGEMNGHQLRLLGGTPVDFFGGLGLMGYPPGWTLGGSTTLYLYSSTIWIDGVPMEFNFPSSSSSLFMSSFSLPTDGRSVTVPVEISFSAIGINFGTRQTIDVSGGARGQVSVEYFNGRYYLSSFVQAPEPGTLGFVASGLIGILTSVRKRRRM